MVAPQLSLDELAALEEFLQHADAQQLAMVQQCLVGDASPARLERMTLEFSLHAFLQGVWPLVEPAVPFRDNWHITGLCKHLEALAQGRISDLLFNVPPGGCKSLLVSVAFPCWVWSWWPAARFMCASYAQELANRDSLRRRQIIESVWYRQRWGDTVRLVGDQNQKTRFANDRTGWMLATSVGGRATGEHPDILLCDDPHKADEVLSDAERQAALEWWSGTIATRGRARGVKRCVIMQRLHEADLSGYLLDQGGWEHLCVPMEFEPGRMQPTSLGWTDPRTEPGELYWPELFTPAKVAQLKRDLVTEYRIAAQLQQRPAPAGGGMFKRAWFPIVERAPDGLKRYARYWDMASTPSGGDYSAGVLIGAHEVGPKEYQWYIIDVVRGQWSALDRNRIIDRTAAADVARYGPKVQLWFEQEPGSGGKEAAEMAIRRLAGYNVHSERVTGDKETRAAPFAAQCEAGNVKLVKADWNLPFVEEHLLFPFGKWDDQVDAAASAHRKLAKPRRKAFFV